MSKTMFGVIVALSTTLVLTLALIDPANVVLTDAPDPPRKAAPLRMKLGADLQPTLAPAWPRESIEEPEVEATAEPETLPHPQRSEDAWHTFLGVADAAGIEVDPERQLSLADWQWMTERTAKFMSVIDKLQAQTFDTKVSIQDAKITRGEYDVITADTPHDEVARLKQPTKPGQIVTLAGSGGQTWVVRINPEDAPEIVAEGLRIEELERAFVVEATTRLGIR